MKNILVTGGLGFIGRHLIEKLNEQDNVSIDVVDNLCNSKYDEKNLPKVDNIYICDFNDFDFPNNKIYHEVYHLASPVGPAGVIKFGGMMGQIIINDLLKVAHYCSEHNSRLLYISTSEVYGPNKLDKQQEESLDKIVPSKYTIRLEYGVGKLLGEICLSNFRKFHDLKYFVIRPFNIVGRDQSFDAGFVIPRFTSQAMNNKDITVFNGGKQKRTFTHVYDIIDAMLLMMKSDHYGHIYNIGNPANIITIEDLAKKVKEKTNSKSKIKYIDPKTIYGEFYEEAWNKIPNIELAQKELNWEPKYDLDTTLDEIIGGMK